MPTQLAVSKKEFDPYRLYILRVWQDTPNGPVRYMLKAADDSHRHVFADVQSLADFLAQVTPGIEGEIQ